MNEWMRYCEKNITERGRSQMTIWRMRFICLITKATNTYSEYAMFIAFSLQQWLHESAPLLVYTHIAFCVVRLVWDVILKPDFKELQYEMLNPMKYRISNLIAKYCWRWEVAFYWFLPWRLFGGAALSCRPQDMRLVYCVLRGNILGM